MQLIGDISPARADAIHRALLSGMISNVAVKTAAHEYTGLRGAKSAIFPGSVLFRKEPRWIAAAELVQTARLYARIAAPIHPAWIEIAAAHLVRRAYADPYWDAASAHVYAVEKVTLHGLVIIPARRVHYGRIDPRTAREIFILHALVRGEFRSEAPALRHNQALMRQVRLVQVRTRRPNLLAEEQELARFFETRLPRDVCSGPQFERWRRRTERTEPGLLEMTLADVAGADFEFPPPDDFPDALETGGLHLPLEYRHDSAHAADGITVVVPLEAVEQLAPDRLEWLVPGFVEQKALALIRSLPKELRKNFIPAADSAREAVAALSFGEGSILERLAAVLGKRAGLRIPAEAFTLPALEPWLRMNIRVVDAAGETIASGRDVGALRRELRARVQAIWEGAESMQHEIERAGIQRWDFGELADRVPLRRRGMTLWGYPALVDRQSSVSLRLLGTPAAARRAMKEGVRRLFLIELGGQLEQLLRSIPRLPQMTVLFAPIADAETFTRDLVAAIADTALFPGLVELPRSQSRFSELAARGWQLLPQAAREVAGHVGSALDAYQAASVALETVSSPSLAPAVREMRDQMRQLVYPGFISATPREWLPHLPRFLAAVSLRLQKLRNAGLARDEAALLQVGPLWREWKALARESDPAGWPAIQQIHWLIEELRVSLFAQELRTSMPISAGRIREALDAAGKAIHSGK